ncbi:hypothetical protein WJX73_004172 [Symbiochloris irregularis]|uniref:Uncharacterized protein n=1 Tax=Symbiochloris irregularis TaxID=706552 RepID=A0AAW1P7F4_9CHLO
MSGGGEAGGSKRSSQVNFQRHVPKFLQAHMHLLGKPAAQSEEEAATLDDQRPAKRQKEDDSESDNADDEEEALQRAVAENPSLAVQYPHLGDLAKKGQAAEEKEKGNTAFTEKKFEQAVAHFSRCIELDPKSEVYFSNRAAALIPLKRFGEAARDARSCAQLKPDWAKGWARLGSALSGLEDFSGAIEAYEHALKLEPDNNALLEAHQRAKVAEHRQSDARQHKFRSKAGDVPVGHRGAKAQPKAQPSSKAAPGALSFIHGDADDSS